MAKQKTPKWVQQIKDESEAFWKTEYPSLTGEDKIAFWMDYVTRTMHTQGEQTSDEYSAFTPAWYKKNLHRDADFPLILRSALHKLGSKVDMKVFYAAVGIRPFRKIPKDSEGSTFIEMAVPGVGRVTKAEGAVKAKLAVAALAKSKK